MELRLLEYFLTVVREENISRAAEVLHVTQPTLSRQMKELEDELHTTLFIRGKRLTLTDSGVMLRRRAEEVVSLMNKIFDIIEEKQKAKTESVPLTKTPEAAAPAPVREMPVIEQSDEDDTEVIAVIAAAVAHIAAESGKELKVRSIKQTSGRRASRGSWAAAAVSDSMRSVS